MNKLFLLVFFFLGSLSCLAQTAEEFYAMGYNAAENENYSQAINLYSQAIALDEKHYSAYYNRAWCFYKTSDFPKALFDLNKAIALNDADAGAYTLRGMIRSKMSNYNSAFTDYQKALELSPDDKMILNNMGVVMEKMESWNEALKYYEKAVAVDNTYQTALNNYQRMQKKVAEINNTKPMTGNAGAKRLTAKDYFDVGMQAADEGDYEVAIRYYSQSLDLNPAYQQAYTHRGWAKYMRGNYAEAAEDLTKAIQINGSKWGYNQRGQAYIRLNKFDEAMKDFQKALSIDPEYRTAKDNLLWVQSRLGVKTDNTPPKIIITSPIQNTRGLEVVKLDETVTVIGKAEDESGIERVLINGSNCNLNNATGDFDASVKLNLGKNTINVVAFDLKGNKAEKSFVIERKSQDIAKTPNETPTEKEQQKEQEKVMLDQIIGTNYALIIATDEYTEWEELYNPIRDAETIDEELTSTYNFKTEVLKNPTQREFINKIKSYAAKTFQPNDQLFIFVAGHGHFDESLGEGYIVSKDSKKEDDARLSYIPQSTFRQYIDNIKCKHILVMLDVCFGGTIDPIVKRRGSFDVEGISKEEFISRKLRYKTRKYITSGGKEYVPDGVPGKHSPFAKSILEALRSYGGRDGILTIAEIISYIENLKPEPCKGEFGENDAGSDFLFIAK